MGASLAIVSVHTPVFSISLEQGDRKENFEAGELIQSCVKEFVLQDSMAPCPNNAVKLYRGGRLVLQMWEHDWRIRFRVVNKNLSSSKVTTSGHSKYRLNVTADGNLEFVDCGSVSEWRYTVPELNLSAFAPEYKASPAVSVHVGAVTGEASLDAAIQQAEQAAEEQLRNEKVRILVMGPSGAGKSSLISMVFPYLRSPPRSGMGVPVTRFEDIDRVWTDEEKKMPVLIHDSQGLELANTDVLRRLKGWIVDRAETSVLSERLHVVWYTLPLAGGIRFQSADIDLIKFIDSFKIPIFIVLTFADKSTMGGEAALRQALEEHVPGIPKGVFTTSTAASKRKEATKCPQCGSDDISFRAKSVRWTCECKHVWQEEWEFKHQLVELVDATTESFTDVAIRNAFAKAQTVSLRPKISQSVVVIVPAVLASVAIGANPIPFSDAALLIPLEFSLINLLAFVWDIRISLKSLAGLGLTQVLFSQTFAVGLASLLKVAFGAGSVAGGIINGTVAGILTTTIGIVYTVGFYWAWKKGWMALSDQQLIENLRTVINPQKFESVRRAVGGMWNAGMSQAEIGRAIDNQLLLEMDDEAFGPPGGPSISYSGQPVP